MAFSAAFIILAACTGSQKTASHREAPVPVKATLVQSASPTPLRLGKSAPPPVRIFAGTQSILGAAVRYCNGQDCVARVATAPRITAPAGSTVTFAVVRAPRTATLDVSGTGGGRFELSGTTLLAWHSRLPAGAHRLTLTLSWAEGEGTWTFQVAGR
ncbi:MAG: hypothetical protein ABR548_11475 [Actinomycetota bacterium]|nr:hypothetical protein [Actinomycetota bacterium]